MTHHLRQQCKLLHSSTLSRAARRPQTFRVAIGPVASLLGGRPMETTRAARPGQANFLKGLILAQNERWRRGLGMQVERIPGGLLSGGSGERGSKGGVTYPPDGNTLGK